MHLHAIENGTGFPVVLLHGLFGNARNLNAIQKPLAGKFRTISLDLRNHGDSPHHPMMNYATMAEDVAETLRDMAVPTCAVVGHSMGGKVAMRLALTRPALVARLAVLDIAPVTYPPAFRDYARAMQALLLTADTMRASALQTLAATIPDAGIRAFLLQNLAFDGPVPHWRIGLSEIAGALPDVEAWPATAGTFSGPTLFAAGEKSDYITADSRPVIREMFPHAQFVRIRGAGHWVHADAPEAVAAILMDFLAGLQNL